MGELTNYVKEVMGNKNAQPQNFKVVSSFKFVYFSMDIEISKELFEKTVKQWKGVVLKPEQSKLNVQIEIDPAQTVLNNEKAVISLKIRFVDNANESKAIEAVNELLSKAV
jgi:hypothetical protein